jgi:hypothetical protein
MITIIPPRKVLEDLSLLINREAKQEIRGAKLEIKKKCQDREGEEKKSLS